MKPSWDIFFEESVRKIFTEKKDIIDIGGGLRVTKTNRVDSSRLWVLELIKKVNYRVLDPVPDYKPDIVGDIHHLPLKDASIEGIFCLAVLEHVEDPIRAVGEMYRVLKKDGLMLAYVPFLFYYHAHKGYYKDFWRFTEDSIQYMCKDFSSVKIVPSRYALETWIKISPLGRYNFFTNIFRFLDKVFRKTKSKQVSGYYVLAQK